MSHASIATIGAGRMGRGIGVALALAGTTMHLVDLRQRSDEAFEKLCSEVAQELRDIYARMQGLGLVQAEQADTLMARTILVRASEAATFLRGTDLLFEAVPETLSAKEEALAAACRHLPASAIIASTSSSMLPSDLARLVPQPERFLNAHWLNPAYLVPLVEVAPHDGTSPEAQARLVAILEQVGKVPVICSGQPGYIVPRLQVLIMNEAARMIEQGAASAADIDKAFRYGFGIRYASMGVAEFIDVGGLDTLYHASAYLTDRLADSRYSSPSSVNRMMKAGELGMKTGRGFYDWNPERSAAFQQESMERFVQLLKISGIDPTCHTA